MDLMGKTELVQHVHLVSCWCNDLEALANFNTQWMDYNVLHFPRCTSRSQNFGERNKKNPESDLCWGSLAGAFHGNHDLYALYAIGSGVLSSLVSGRLPSLSGIGYHCQTPAPRNLREEKLDVMVSRGEGWQFLRISAFPGVCHVLIFINISPVFHDIS